MNILFDTGFLVQLDRKNPEAIELAKKLMKKDFHFAISMVTVAEIMTGVYLRKDLENAKDHALSVLAQFSWVEMNGHIADRTGEILAYLKSQNKLIDFADVAIAATALEISAQYLVTENKKDFMQIPLVREKVVSIKELKEKV